MFIRAARADCCPQTVVRRLYPQHPLTALNFICQIYSHAICSVTSRALHLWYGQGAGGFTTMVYTVCDFANLTGRSVVLGRSFVVYGCPRNHAHKLRISYALCLCACQENKCLLIMVGGGWCRRLPAWLVCLRQRHQVRAAARNLRPAAGLCGRHRRGCHRVR